MFYMTTFYLTTQITTVLKCCTLIFSIVCVKVGKSEVHLFWNRHCHPTRIGSEQNFKNWGCLWVRKNDGDQVNSNLIWKSSDYHHSLLYQKILKNICKYFIENFWYYRFSKSALLYRWCADQWWSAHDFYHPRILWLFLICI